MKPHPRIRRTVKWGGVAASVALAAVWIGTRWWYGWWVSSHGVAIQVAAGRVAVVDTRLPSGVRSGWTLDTDPEHRMQWWFNWGGGPLPFLTVPLWAPLLATGLATALLWRGSRRPGPGCCVGCGYDLRGLPAGAGCPECGADQRLPASTAP